MSEPKEKEDGRSSPEIKAIRAEQMRARWANPEFRAKTTTAIKVAEQNKSPEWRAKISQSVSKLWADPVYHESQAKAVSPTLRRPDVQAKRAEAMRTPQVRAKISESVTAAMARPDVRAKFEEGMKNRRPPQNWKISERGRRILSEKMKRYQAELCATESGRMKILRNILDHVQLKPNKCELRLDEMLQRNFPDEWEYVGDGKIRINNLNPDFVSKKDPRLLIELFGRYWHEEVVDDWKRTEFGRLAIYSQLGYRCAIIYDDELVDEAKVIAKINALREVMK